MDDNSLNSHPFQYLPTYQNSLLVERQTQDCKVMKVMLAEAVREFSSPELILCADSYLVSVTAVAHKRSWSFFKKCRWQGTHKHACTLDPTKSEWADYAADQAQCGNLSVNELKHNLSGNSWPQLSHLAEPLWTDPGLKSGISVCKLISTLKKKSAGGE